MSVRREDTSGSDPHRTNDPNSADLDQLQRWMLDVITHPDGVHAGLESDSVRATIDIAPESIESVITPSQALDSFQRLNVYANAYYSRLLECIQNSFPALVDAIGEEAFDAFSFGYLQTHPPSSYTLNDLTNQFIEYLEQTRPKDDSASDGAVDEVRVADWTDFIIDLARLEEAFDIVFDGPGTEEAPVAANWVESLQAETWESTRLVVVPCLQLFRYRFPVNQFYSAWRKSQSPALACPADSYLAITRRDYIVRRFELEADEYALLNRLSSGQSIGEAIDEVSETVSDVDAFSTSLHGWFQRWAKLGLFCGVM